MDYSAADVKKLRDETGATFADCKNALTEANSWGDAVKILEERGKRNRLVKLLWTETLITDLGTRC